MGGHEGFMGKHMGTAGLIDKEVIIPMGVSLTKDSLEIWTKSVNFGTETDFLLKCSAVILVCFVFWLP